MRVVLANQATDAKRQVTFHLVDATDGITAETGETGGQPQISTNGASFTNTGIGTLVSIGSGRYYAYLTQTAVATAGSIIETRYKSASTAECPGDSVQVVAFDPDDAADLGLTNLDATITSRAASATALTNATWTDVRAGYLDATISSRSTCVLTQASILSDATPFAGASIATIATGVARLLGLSHDNVVIDNQTWDSDNNLTGARLRVFSSAALANAATAGGSEAADFTWTMTGTYTAALLSLFRVVRA